MSCKHCTKRNIHVSGFRKQAVICLTFIICLFLVACNNYTDGDWLRRSDQDIRDFGIEGVIHYEYCTNDNLYNYLDKIKSTPGNYAVNISGDAMLVKPVVLSNGVTISLRGDSRRIILSEDGCIFAIGKGAKLILRNITLDGEDNNGNFLIYLRGEFVMENGAFLTNGEYGAVDNNGGSFIMYGGEIRSCGGDPDTICVYGNSASFQKNSGGIIRGKTGEFANSPPSSVIGIWSTNSYKLLYRDSTIGSEEILRLLLDAEGNSISYKTGNWESLP